MRKILVTFLCFFSVWVGQAQNREYAFTLEEAINYAIDSSYTAINSRREIAKAIKQKWETTASGLPQINATVNYQNQLKQPVSFIPSEFFGGEAGEFTPVVFGTEQTASAVATLDQFIFDGSYLVGLQAARAFLDYSENANEKTQLEIRRGVINAYGSVLLAEELVDIFEKNKATLENNLFETQKIFENGLTEEENVEQLEITLLDIDTRLSNAIRSRDIARQMFNLALGIDVQQPVTLTEDLDALTKENMNLGLLDPNINVEANVDFKIAYNLTEQRNLELKLEKSRALPKLTAFLNYGTQAAANEFAFLDSDTPWFQYSILGLNLNIPIFSSGMRGAKTQRARIALDQAETQLEETIQSINLQFDTAKSNYQFAVETYENSTKHLSLAERIEQKNQVKYSEGISSSFDLRQAQLQLYTAQQQYFQSMLNVINAKAELETVLNTPQFRNR